MSQEPATLPRGRHHLTREQVRASQRGRMLRAMAEAVAEKGYAQTTVADVTRRARASRETFYEQFANKQDCFLAAYEEVVAHLTDRLRSAAPAADPAPARIERVLDAYLGTLAAEPALARTFLIEVYAAGPEAWRRRAEVLERFADVAFEVLAADPGFRRLPDPHFSAQALAGAISSLVTGLVAAGEHERLPALREPVMELVGALLGGARDR